MNKKYSHCFFHNKAHKLMADKVSGWMCLCACLCVRGKKANLAKEFPVLNCKRKTESRQNKDAAKASAKEKGQGLLSVCRSVSMRKLNRIQWKAQIMKALNLEQHVHINTATQAIQRKRKNNFTYVLHSFQMGASYLMWESGSVLLFKRQLIF